MDADGVEDVGELLLQVVCDLFEGRRLIGQLLGIEHVQDLCFGVAKALADLTLLQAEASQVFKNIYN